MTPEEIAALVAGATEPEPEPEPAPAAPSDDPNHVMTPEEIAALVAGASEPEPEAVAEPALEPAPAAPSDDPNHVMTPEEIEALLEGNEGAAGESAPEPKSAPEPSDDPNHVMTPEEIAALLAGNEEAAGTTAGEENAEEALDEDLMLSDEALADLLSAVPELGDEEHYDMPEGLNAVDLGMDDSGIEAAPEATEESTGDAPVEMDLSDSDLFDIGDADLEESIAGDEEAAAINELLNADEQGTILDDDVLSILEGTDAEGGEPGEEEQREDIFSLDGIDEIREESTGDILFGDIAEMEEGGEKKKGLFARIIEFLFGSKGKKKEGEEGEEEEEGRSGLEAENPAGDENMAILKELDALDEEEIPEKKEKKKKEKKEKKPKPKKEKKKKEKKPKPPKPKKEKKPVELEPGKPISKKFIVAIAIVCGSFLALMIFAVNKLPGFTYAREAREAFGKEDYETVYRMLAGIELEGSDADLYQKSFMLMKMKRYGEMCRHWLDAGDQVRAVDIMVKAVTTHDNSVEKASEYGVFDKYQEYYFVVTQMMDEVSLTEDMARSLATIEDNINYSMAIEDFLYGPKSTTPHIPEEILRLYGLDASGQPLDQSEGEGEAETEEMNEEDQEEEFSEEEEESEDEESEDEGSEEEEESNEDSGESVDLFTLDGKQDSNGNYHAGN